MLESSFTHARNRNVRRLVEFDPTYPNSTNKGLLLYDSGLVAVPGLGRERSYLFLLPDATWLRVHSGSGARASSQSVPRSTTIQLLPALEEFGVQGRAAVRSIHRLLVFLAPKTRWKESWQDLGDQVKSYF